MLFAAAPGAIDRATAYIAGPEGPSLYFRGFEA